EGDGRCRHESAGSATVAGVAGRLSGLGEPRAEAWRGRRAGEGDPVRQGAAGRGEESDKIHGRAAGELPGRHHREGPVAGLRGAAEGRTGTSARRGHSGVRGAKPGEGPEGRAVDAVGGTADGKEAD